MIWIVLSKEKLLELAIDIEGHPDNVVPSLLGGLCMTAKAASQRWRVVRCEWICSVKAVVAIPSIRLSTSEARRAMPKAIPVSDAVVNLGQAAKEAGVEITGYARVAVGEGIEKKEEDFAAEVAKAAQG